MIEKENNRDPIIEEIHRARQQMAEKFGGDIAAILEDARQRQTESGRPLWRSEASGKKSGRSSPQG